MKNIFAFSGALVLCACSGGVNQNSNQEFVTELLSIHLSPGPDSNPSSMMPPEAVDAIKMCAEPRLLEVAQQLSDVEKDAIIALVRTANSPPYEPISETDEALYAPVAEVLANCVIESMSS